eukprot:scaffold135128_cov39-Prasinocladus_malaysianus.AAC.1
MPCRKVIPLAHAVSHVILEKFSQGVAATVRMGVFCELCSEGMHSREVAFENAAGSLELVEQPLRLKDLPFGRLQSCKVLSLPPLRVFHSLLGLFCLPGGLFCQQPRFFGLLES